MISAYFLCSSLTSHTKTIYTVVVIESGTKKVTWQISPRHNIETLPAMTCTWISRLLWNTQITQMKMNIAIKIFVYVFALFNALVCVNNALYFVGGLTDSMIPLVM